MALIYEPKGAAREYAAWALNHYIGCDHACKYCYGPGALQTTRDKYMEPRARVVKCVGGFMAALRREAEAPRDARHVLLSFACDPYCHLDEREVVTRDVIEMLHMYGHTVSICTKGGSRALRDLDMLDPGDEFGASLTFVNAADSLAWEPFAALPSNRIRTLAEVHFAGIRTWASLEPVIDPAQSLALIRATAGIVDTYKIGAVSRREWCKHRDWYPDYDQRAFVAEAIEACRAAGASYYIKDSLVPFLPEGVARDSGAGVTR